jgi:Icc-related predicted phosphoesterase
MKKILVFSDTHGDFDKMYYKALKNNADIILHCGDLIALKDSYDLYNFLKLESSHFFSKSHNLILSRLEYKKYFDKNEVPIPTYFISGNHENFIDLHQYTEGPVEIIKNLFYIGKYAIFQIDNFTIAGLSGVYSNKIYNNSIYWNNPAFAGYFTKQSVQNLINKSKEYNKIDVLLLHESPYLQYNQFEDNKYIGAKIIDELISEINPKIVFVGHMHINMQLNYKNTKIIYIDYNDFINLNQFL